MDPLMMNYLAQAIQQDRLDKAAAARRARAVRESRSARRSSSGTPVRRTLSWFDHAIRPAAGTAH